MKKKYNLNFINNELIDDEKYLWRYMDFHKFLSFIFKESLYFTRLDKFDDKREGITLKHLFYQNVKKNLDNHPMFDEVRKYSTIDTMGSEMNKIDSELENIQRFNFANCWNIGEKESESVAMWNLYSNPESLAIRINYKNLKDKITINGIDSNFFEDNIICGPVKYFDFQKNPDGIDLDNPQLNSVFTKDKSFNYENEYRIIIQEKIREIPEINYKDNIRKSHIEKQHNSFFNYPGIELKLKDFQNYQFEIILHPKSQKWIKGNIKKVMKKFNIKFQIFESNLTIE